MSLIFFYILAALQGIEIFNVLRFLDFYLVFFIFYFFIKDKTIPTVNIYLVLFLIYGSSISFLRLYFTDSDAICADIECSSYLDPQSFAANIFSISILFFKYIEYLLFFWLGIKFAEKYQLIYFEIGVKILLVILISWSFYHFYLWSNNFIKNDRADFPFIFNGGQQLSSALYILLVSLTYILIHKKNYITFFIFLIFCLFPFYTSGGRAGLIGLSIFSLFFLIYYFRFYLILFLSFLVYSFVQGQSILSSLGFRFGTASDAGRIRILRLIEDRLYDDYFLILFGQGFAHAYWYDMFIIHILYEFGLLGFLFLFLFSLYVFSKIIKVYGSTYKLFWIFVLVSFGFQLIVAESMVTDRTAPLILLSLGYMWYNTNIKSKF
tara:strand:- start:16796 stop:17932 length:1137 start_codon:yes stop_codon:yes gene_type:complete